MKILVTGCNGQLGRELHTAIEARREGITTYIDIDDLDLTDREAVGEFIREGEFSHIINCAAYTAVDRAEEEKLQCAAVNSDALTNIAHLAGEMGIHVLHVSTDYVFDGCSCRPYNESDKVNPLSVYGITKRKGETALLGLAPDSIVVRTGWLYSPWGKNFVKTMLRLARENRTVSVVSDQIGTPTSATDLASAIVDIVFATQWAGGIYHFSNEGVASWYDFAVAAIEAAGITDCTVNPIPTKDYPTAAVRPMYAVLDKSKIKATYGLRIPHWRESLVKVVRQIEDQR